MVEVTEQQIVGTLATKVMGWSKGKYIEDGAYIADAWYDDQGDFMEWVRDWQPTERIDHAWQVMEEINKSNEQKRHFNTWMLLEVGANAFSAVTPKAICKAATKTVESL
ncbi:hypothetical protein EDM57_04655 [Brevibacillus gelatini]|uniref:Phage ABA sandwich domain-containing protein n=1 Tax=Brevibacillus gelatini TaxID=1655277 RepID=A0A3M8B7M0_9BACL|nr:hypothetical protein [Brevibacillus gelatini]RNB59436.1 hypothetical protein EDM57_04655 [Brevibacillus gelatini]